MNLEKIKYCPSTLAEGFLSYSPSALRNMFYGKKVSHILDFDAPIINETVAEQFRQNSKIISVSGAQFKQSLILEKNKLRLTQAGEQGHYILKPIPFNPPFAKAEELPANEHLVMQIARQAYGIATAECALIFFRDGSPAYITKRFDIQADGTKTAQEDFASLSEISKERDGKDYRFTGSYEGIARVMKKFVGAYIVEAEKYFERVIFNYLFSNGDAHLKNFSLQQSSLGDYLLSPAYDLLNTHIHIPSDTCFALSDGLFPGCHETASFSTLGFYSYDDFYEFGQRIGLMEVQLKKLIKKYRIDNQKVKNLTHCSFLNIEVKATFLNNYTERLQMLNTSYNKKI